MGGHCGPHLPHPMPPSSCTHGLVVRSPSLGSFGQCLTFLFQQMLGSELLLKGKDLLTCQFLSPGLVAVNVSRPQMGL